MERLEARNQQRLARYVFDFRRTYEGRDPFRPSVILEVHAITVAGIYPSAGRFREMSEGVEIPGAGFTPSPVYRVESEVNDLLSRVARVARRTDRFDWKLAYAAIAFRRFLTIHPFLDGNGRVGRAFHLMMLYEFGLLQPPQQVFDFFRRYRDTYLEALRAADEGHGRPWIALNRIAVLDWHFQLLYDNIRRDPVWRHHVLSKLSRTERRLLSRQHRLTLELDEYAQITHQLHQRMIEILSNLADNFGN